jgi:hypothetical protein
MKSLTHLIFICLILLSVSNTAHAEIVHDPFAHYLSTYRGAYSTNDEVLFFNVDFDENTRILFISLTSLVDGKAGNIWLTYAQGENGYEPLQQPISLRKDALAFTTLERLKGNGLITYWPISAMRGTLRAIQPEAGKILDHNLGQMEPAEKDKDLYAKLFLNEAIKVHVRERPVTEILAASKAETIPSPPRATPEESIGISQPTTSIPLPPVEDSTASDIDKSPGLTTGKSISWIFIGFGAALLCLLIWIGIMKRQTNQ